MKTALVLIDIQDGLDSWSYYGDDRSHPQAEKNCQLLLQTFRGKDLPVFHVKHNSANEKSPLHPTNPGNRIKTMVQPLPNELVYQKDVNSAFIGTSLEKDLKDREVMKLVFIGFTIEHCISSSVRMSANLGFETILVHDATAAFSKKDAQGNTISAELVHEVSTANLREEFAEVTDTDSLIEKINHDFSSFI